MRYKHLTAAQRGVIQGLLQSNFTLKDIAEKLGVSLSTVSREINKRRTPKGYFADIAQIDYERRRKRSGKKEDALFKKAKVHYGQSSGRLVTRANFRQTKT